MKRDELPLVTLDLRHAGALLAHPCLCGAAGCSLGEHLWRALDDMRPGPRAQSTEPRAPSGPTTTGDGPEPIDTTGTLHAEYRRKLTTAQNACRDLAAFVGKHRPDRWVPDPTPATDDMWCTNHLEHFGSCEPRHTTERFTSDLCRWCYDIRRLHGFVPDRTLMRARHEHRRITDADMADARKRAVALMPPRRGKTKRTKAS